MKTCSSQRCPHKNPQPLDAFAKDSKAIGSKQGRRSRCKTCEITDRSANRNVMADRSKRYYDSHPIECRGSRLRKHWKQLSRQEALAAYERLLRHQEGKCAICGEAESVKDRNGKPKALAVDHCHKTGNVRGLLCAAHNIGLGVFKDDIKRLRAAADYLEARKNQKQEKA